MRIEKSFLERVVNRLDEGRILGDENNKKEFKFLKNSNCIECISKTEGFKSVKIQLSNLVFIPFGHEIVYLCHL